MCVWVYVCGWVRVDIDIINVCVHIYIVADIFGAAAAQAWDKQKSIEKRAFVVWVVWYEEYTPT